MKKEDEVLMEVYMSGFNDELDSKEEMFNPNPLLLRAYNLGRLDAAVGDDVSSVDQQTNEEIIDRIKNG